MLRALLKPLIFSWLSGVIVLLLLLGLGKTASATSEIAFFSNDFNGASYWRLDLGTGASFHQDYDGYIVASNTLNTPSQHFLLLESDADYSNIYEINPQTQERRFIWTYSTRHYRMYTAGDYIFLIDYRNHWWRLHIPTAEYSDFGEHPRRENLQTSPDSTWLVGSANENWYFINLLDGSSYSQRALRNIAWSHDSQWYFAVSSENPAMISVLSAADGSPHPVLSAPFAAQNAAWGSDSETIFFLASGYLASISLRDGLITTHPSAATYFATDCFSPNQAYGLLLYNNQYQLSEIATGRVLWQPNKNFGLTPSCLWTEDSRYLLLYLTSYSAGISRPIGEWERFFVIDTQSGQLSDLYPDSLPSLPLYLHFTD